MFYKIWKIIILIALQSWWVEIFYPTAIGHGILAFGIGGAMPIILFNIIMEKQNRGIYKNDKRIRIR